MCYFLRTDPPNMKLDSYFHMLEYRIYIIDSTLDV